MVEKSQYVDSNGNPIRLALLGLIFIATGAVAEEPGMTFGPPDRVAVIEPSSRSTEAQDLAARLDRLAVEFNDKIAEQQKLAEERDKRYSQRFDAQQEAVSAALLAAKEAVANALSAAKEAVIKAEVASEKRFEAVNEFRRTLSDQASNFLSKDAAEVRFKALEELAGKNVSRLDAIAAAKMGAGDNWVWIIGVIGIIGIIASFIFGVRNIVLRGPSK